MEALFYRTEILSQHNFRPKEFVLAYEARVDDPNVSTARVVNQAVLHGELHARANKKPVRLQTRNEPDNHADLHREPI